LDVRHYPYTYDLVCQNDTPEEAHGLFRAQSGYFVSEMAYSGEFWFSIANNFPNSASIATLIRLKFLVELADTSDILCMSRSMSFTLNTTSGS
jgi:hypothetical protein